MESVANSVEDYLVDGLSFQLEQGASYVVNRRSCTFFPSGSNIYTSTNGTRQIRMVLASDGWLDPSTFRLMFNLTNTDATAGRELRPLGGPWSFFRRVRILAGGQVIEDIDNYNRTHEMFHILTNPQSRINDYAESFGQFYNCREYDTAGCNAQNLRGIPSGQSCTVLFKPLSGLFSQPKYLPLRYMPITIELELVDNMNDPIVYTAAVAPNPIIDPTLFYTSNTSMLWQIDNVQAKMDLITLDTALENSYAQHLLSGKTIPINYNTYISQLQSIVGGTDGLGVALGQQTVLLNIARSITRLKSVFVTLDAEAGNWAQPNPIARKPWTNFYSPMNATAGGAYNAYDSGREFEFQLQIGSKLFPEYPIRSHAEAYYQLRKALGVQSSAVHAFDISSKEYRSDKMILGIDTEKVLDAGWTGQNTRAGDLLTVKFKHTSTVAATYATKLYVVLHADMVLEIAGGGVQVMD